MAEKVPESYGLTPMSVWVTLGKALTAIAVRLNLTITHDGADAMQSPLRLATFTVATRPAASAWSGGIIFVSDGGAGAEFQGSNGTAWINIG